jgi:tetratricopeptide (TPR) repeat protein
MDTTLDTVRVFIFSTFRDMHAERDHLVTVVFPELRERVERLGLEFFDVDRRVRLRPSFDGQGRVPANRMQRRWYSVHMTTKPCSPKRLFISYGHDEHLSLSVRLRDDLRKRGHDVWFDEERLKPGHDWELSIEQGLAHLAADKVNAAVILLLTPHSVRRPDGFCLNEVARALALGLRIIPLMVVESEPPLSICRIQWLDMRECIPIQAKEAFYRPRFERLLQALEEDQLDFEGTQQRLLKALQPLEFDADILKHLPKFTGRQWAFDKVNTWLANNPPQQRIFWITGDPGVGKTALSAVLSSRYLEVAALHLCEYGHRQKSDPRCVVTSVVYQLTTQLPEYEARLAAMDVERLVQDDARTLFDNLLVQPLTKITPPNRPIVILIDALDEATRDGCNELANFIATEFPKTPAWLRLIITSRPKEEAVTAPLQGLKPFILNTKTEANRDDLRDYLHRELAPLLKDRSDANRISEHILDRSEGVFLYVEHVCDDLQRGNLSLDRLGQFPQGLGGFFFQCFQRQFPDCRNYEKTIEPALGAILAAHEPLPIDILQKLFRWRETELRKWLRTFGSLFPVTTEGGHEVVRAYHKSLADWLAVEGKAGRYYVSIPCGHRLLADFGWKEFHISPANISVYSSRHLAGHLLDLEDRDKLVKLSSAKKALGHGEVRDSLVKALVELDGRELNARPWAGSPRACSDMLVAIWRKTRGDCAELLLAFADASEMLGRWERVFEVLSWVRNWSVAHSSENELAALIALAQVESSRGSARDSLLLAHRAYTLAKEAKERAGTKNLSTAIQLMRTANTLARAYFDMGDIDGRYDDYLVSATRFFEVVQRAARDTKSAGIHSGRIDRQLARALNNLGVIRRLLGQTARARVCQTQAWKLRDASGGFRDRAWSLRDLAWLDWDEGCLEKARARFEEALTFAEKAGNPQAQVWLLRDLAKFCEIAERNDRSASEYQRRAWTIMTQMPAVDTYYDLGGYVRPSARSSITLQELASSARTWYQAAVKWYARQKQPWAVRGRANALRGLAWTYWSVGHEDLVRASKISKQECLLRAKTGEMRETAQSLVAYARLGFRAIGHANTELSESIFSHVLACAESLAGATTSLDIQRVLAAAHYGMANLRLAQDNVEDALNHFQKTRVLRESADPSRIGSVLARIGTCHLQMGRLREAEQCLADALVLSQQWHDAEVETRACRHLSKIYMDRLKGKEVNLLKAQEFAEKALLAARRSPDESATEEALNAFGDVKLAQGHLEEARKLNLDALRHAEKSGRRWGVCRCLLALTIVEARRGCLKPAERYCHRAKDLASKAANDTLVKRARLVADYLEAIRTDTAVSRTYERLREKEFRWLPA